MKIYSLTGFPSALTGSFTGSFFGDGSGLTGTDSGSWDGDFVGSAKITGSLSLSGSFKDQGNSPGTAGQVLSSTVSGSQWVDVEDPDAVTGAGNVGTIPKWATTTSLGNSIITEAASAITVGGAATFSNIVRIYNYTLSSDFGTGYNISLGVSANGATDKGINFGWNTTSDFGFIGAVHNATGWKSLVLQPVNGTVGIRTTSPSTSYVLDVGGATRISGDVTLSKLTTATGLEYQVRNANGASGDHVFKSYNSAILTLNGATNAATFSGNVEVIKSSTPTIQLTQSGATNYKGYVKLAGNDLEIRGSSGAMEFYNGSVDGNSSALRMSISSGGDVTITQPTNGSDAVLNLTAKSAGGNTRTTSLTYDADTEKLIINNAGTEILRMGSSTGVIESNYGIAFPNQSAGSGTVASSTLDAYEEGTWTALLTTTGNPFNNQSNQTATYTRIGNLVTVQMQALTSGATSSGTGEVIVTGLPFTSTQAAYGSFNTGRVALSNTLGGSASIPTSTTYIRFLFLVSGNNANVLDASALNGQSTPYISATITYQI